MGYLAPTAERDIKAIFKEKVFGTDVFLVSAETIAYLKWLIYRAVFKDADQRDKVAGELGLRRAHCPPVQLPDSGASEQPALRALESHPQQRAGNLIR